MLRGLYRSAAAPEVTGPTATILFSGTAHTEVAIAQRELAEHYGVGAELWSATSYQQLRAEALEVERWNRLHPGDEPRDPVGDHRARTRPRDRSSRSPTSCAPCPTRSRAGHLGAS